MTSTALSRNGIRQAHCSNAGPAAPLTSLTTPVEQSRPRGTPSCGHEAMNQRWRCEPHSIDISTEPPHSPPTPMPWTTRSRVSSTGAASPIVA